MGAKRAAEEAKAAAMVENFSMGPPQRGSLPPESDSDVSDDDDDEIIVGVSAAAAAAVPAPAAHAPPTKVEPGAAAAVGTTSSGSAAAPAAPTPASAPTVAPAPSAAAAAPLFKPPPKKPQPVMGAPYAFGGFKQPMAFGPALTYNPFDVRALDILLYIECNLFLFLSVVLVFLKQFCALVT